MSRSGAAGDEGRPDEKVMRAGRGRWKIENETFNTLKNQGYHFEHNYGHGGRNLATALALMMMLAFLIVGNGPKPVSLYP